MITAGRQISQVADQLSELGNAGRLAVEMQEFLKQMDGVKSFLTEHPLTSTVQSEWNNLSKKAGQLKGAYGISS